MAVAGSQIVGPPPSVQGTPDGARSARWTSLSGSGTNVVPPPAEVDSAGAGAGSSRSSLIAGTGTGVVPPPPSIQGRQNSSRLGGGISGSGTSVVPPAPSVQGASSGGSRTGSLAGANSQVVPPPPSIQHGGGKGGGGSDERANAGALSSGGTEVVPPPVTVAEARDASSMERSRTNDLQPVIAVAQNPSKDNKNPIPVIEEMPLGSLGLVLALPGTSFFSNFEVFVAKRRMGKEEMQPIKLVYEFLPYQRRLSE